MSVRPNDNQAKFLLLATSLGFAVVQLDVSVVNVALRSIGLSLGGNMTALQWIVNAYTISFAACILTAGALGDRIGAKRIFVIGFIAFTLSSILCGLTPTVAILLIARVMQGVGAAVLVPCSLALLNHTYRTTAARTRAVSLWAAGASAALAGGPLIGGILTTALGWRSIFFINVPIGITGVWLTLRYANETTRTRGEGIDIFGQLTAIIGLVALAAATIEGGSRGFTDHVVLIGYLIAFMAGCAFLLVENKQLKPMLPLGLFKSQTFASMTAIGLLINVAFYGLIFALSLFFQQIQHLSALRAGFAFAPMTVAILVGNLNAGRIKDAFGMERTLIIGALLATIGDFLSLYINKTIPYFDLVGQLSMIGLGLGVIVPIMTSTLLGSIDKPRSGIASGVLNTARQTGSVVGVSLFGSLIAGGHVISGLRWSLVVSTGLFLMVIALVLRIKEAKNA